MSQDRKSPNEYFPVVSTNYSSNRAENDQGPAHASSALPMQVQFEPRGVPQGYHSLGQRSAQTTYQTPEAPPNQRPTLDILSRRLPVIQTYSPTEGSQGTNVGVYIYILSDPESPPPVHLSLMFGSKCCNSSLTKLETQGQYLQYLLAAAAPPFASTGWVDPEVPIYLRVEDESRQDFRAVEVGNFTYSPPRSEPLYESPQTTARKRKSSVGPDSPAIPTKRTSRQDLLSRNAEDFPRFSYPAVEGNLYQPYSQSDAASHASSNMTGFSSPPASVSYGQHASPRTLSYTYSKSSTMSAASPEKRATRPESWGAAFSDLGAQPSRSPAMAASSSSARAGGLQLPPPGTPSNPPLIRTSTIPQPSNLGHLSMGGSQTGQAFNPYAMYPHKAVLKIQGDLDSMAENWGLDEWAAKRRLVQFQRQQSGNTIYASFHPVSPSERPTNSICVSCIWWEEKGECYVTSVDTIYLLESLVAVRFTVEEKNRIRRNLEGFRPLTVSKGKPDSEEFFKVIMGFPAPKPRNIEKDVKVFPWKILSHALKKIIGKYSASYSSTAGALHTAVSPTAYCSGGSGTSTVATTSPEYQPMTSPHSSISESFASTASYRSRLPSSSLSPNLSRALAPHSSLGGRDLRLGFPQTRQQSITSSLGEQAFVGQAGRPSWDLGSYFPTSTAMSMSEVGGGSESIDYVSTGLGPADETDVLPSQTGGNTSGGPSISGA